MDLDGRDCLQSFKAVLLKWYRTAGIQWRRLRGYADKCPSNDFFVSFVCIVLLYAVCYMLYAIRYTPCAICCTLYAICCTLYAMCNTLYAMPMRYMLYAMLCYTL